MTESNQLICGDAIAEMKKIPDGYVDLTQRRLNES